MDTGKQDHRSIGEQDHRSLALWAADCAKHVLGLFEQKHPEDDRPRNAIDVGRSWARGELTMTDARCCAVATHAAARDADDAAAVAAARAAGHAAATAHMATRAPHAANYAVKAVIAADTAEQTTTAATERDWQRRHLCERLWPVAFPAQASP